MLNPVPAKRVKVISIVSSNRESKARYVDHRPTKNMMVNSGISIIMFAYMFGLDDGKSRGVPFSKFQDEFIYPVLLGELRSQG